MMDSREALKKRLEITGKFIGTTGSLGEAKLHWVTRNNQLVDPDIAGTPMPDILVQLIRLTKTPLEMIYRIQQGLGVFDENGDRIPIGVDSTRPKPEGYQLFRDALAWLGSNYPGGWFCGVETIYKEARNDQQRNDGLY